jgi:uncharacterized linocin/CFP29 family protein
MTTRGGYFELGIGRDMPIGYASHAAAAVELYFQEGFAFRLPATTTVVVLARQEK